MDAPPVQYVKTRDGYSIAYGVSGQGTPLIFLPGTFYHVQLAWEMPGLEQWLHGLAERFRLIQLDPRGTGMSSRDVQDNHVQVDYQRDLDAVVERLKLERFIVMGASRGVDLAVDYALRYPDHVIALIFGTSGTGSAQQAIFKMLPKQDWEIFLNSLVPHERSPDEGRRIVELTRQASDQRNYLLRWRAFDAEGSIEPRLARIKVPTLVMHARDYLYTPVEEGMKVARHIGGRLVVLDGSDPWGNSEQGLRAIDNFLQELSSQQPQAEASDALSKREREVLRLLAAGRSNQQIAEELVISSNTVRRHVSNIFDKIGVVNRAEAGIYARDHGLH